MDLTWGYGMITGQRAPHDRRAGAEIYREILDFCVLAEDLGYDAAWLSEHHFVDDGYMPSLLATAAAIAAVTDRIQIGTGVLVAPLHDPIRIAEDAATVDLISGSRLILGLGAGYRDVELAGFGKKKEQLGATLETTVEVLRGAWSGQAISSPHSGLPVQVTPTPDRSDGLPIWLGARTRAGIRRAARIADGMLAARVTPAEFGGQVALFAEEASAIGRDPAMLQVGVHCPVFVHPDRDPWSLLREHFSYLEWKYGEMDGRYHGRVPKMSETTERRLRAEALVGTVDKVAEQVAAYVAAASGLRMHFIARLYWPGMDPAVQRDGLAEFATRVVPAAVG